MRGSILIAGPAGYGINTLNDLLSQVLKNKGLNVYSNKDYMSRIRGGFNFTKIRFSVEELYGFDPKVDYIVALDKQGISMLDTLRTEGLYIGTSNDEIKDERALLLDDAHIKKTFGKWTFSMAAFGVILAQIGFEINVIDELSFGKWPDHVVEGNKKAIEYGYSLVDEKSKKVVNIDSQTVENNKNKLLISGNQAIALGAAAGGLDFYCAYPMAPSTGVMTYLSKYAKDMSLVVEQAEDEIAAVNAAIGASATGVRAMTGSSGGGYALMTEAIGFSAVGEVPLVLVNVQRPGPATGLPTRTEQADLNFVLYASQGEFSRMIMAPRSIEDCFYQTFRALNIADKYNMPVTILSDEYMADSVSTVPMFKLDELKIERHEESNFEDYKRYNFEHVTGHRAYPGLDENTLIMTDSHVHNEDGSITEDPDVTNKLKYKLMQKQVELKNEVLEPLYLGVEKPDVLLTSWGSSYGAIKEVVEELLEEGKSIGFLSFNDIFPLPTKKLHHYKQFAKKIINIEQNYTNQFGQLLLLHGDVRYNASINKYDGRPFSTEDIRAELEVLLNE